MPSSALTSCSSTRAPLSTPGTTPAPSHLPTPPISSPPPILLPVADCEASTTGREGRVRKSVNYAEPKLNAGVSLSILQSTSYLTFRPLQKDVQTGSRDAGDTIIVGEASSMRRRWRQTWIFPWSLNDHARGFL